ncbi:hypothetical protein MSLAZ_1773 [Methanosarcina lacustris Z-7289]|uniref:Uncharacterized protein n=1 Tax=Methanosarcina lacustris Z-7289 TaxID=1434111 RepID=A0A0E3S2J5_9EURY|nr:hypothetical protein MSLAZ_1773 [Methanosarcina lacustris Z-7289]
MDPRKRKPKPRSFSVTSVSLYEAVEYSVKFISSLSFTRMIPASGAVSAEAGSTNRVMKSPAATHRQKTCNLLITISPTVVYRNLKELFIELY